MNTLDRYLFKEILGPTCLGFAIYTLAMLLNQFPRLAEIAAKRGVSLWVIAKMLLSSLPSIAVLTVPMAFLVGLLIAFSRMSADSEITALRASGVSYARIFRPAWKLGVLFALVTLVMTLFGMPWGNSALINLRLKVFSTNVAKAVEPRIFFEGIPRFLLYFDHSEPRDPYVRRVFISQETPGQPMQQSVTFAEQARLSVDEENTLVVHLEESETHIVDPRQPDIYEKSEQGSQNLKPPEASSRGFMQQRTKGLREQTLGELSSTLKNYRATADPKARLRQVNSVWVEIHKKFAIPVACLVFALLGIPLGISNARGGKVSGFVISIGVFIAYWIFLWGGERLSDEGRLSPVWAMWSANLVFAAWGALLFWKRSRNVDWGIWRRLRKLAHDHMHATFVVVIALGIGAFLVYGILSGNGETPSDKGGLPPVWTMWLAFLALAVLGVFLLGRHYLNLLDLYALGLFAGFFALVMFSFLALFLIIEAVQLVDDLVKHGVSSHVFANYLLFTIPRFVSWALPLSALVTAMLAVSFMVRNNEVIAVHAAGVSALRMAVPLLLICSALSLGLFTLQDFVLPTTNRRAEQLKDTIRGRSPRTYARPSRQWIFGEGYRLYNFSILNPVSGRMHGVHVFTLNPMTFSVRERVFARTAVWQEEKESWRFERGWVRRFRNEEEEFEPFDVREFPFSESPAYFEPERWKSPDVMNFVELRRHIKDSRQAGYQVRSLVVNLHKKFSFSLVPFLLAMLGIPVALRLGRHGALFGLGLSIALAVLYYIAFVFFNTMGLLGTLPPALAAWAADILFSIAGLYAFWLAPT
ncbi:MAG: LptF/LptG family permease [Acidobacteriota bacterium]|nr:MAG: LptF/LptG family permease [Acidobacteriota bacterium]